MNDGAAARPPVPVTYWIVVIVSLLWNAFGGYDYLMTRMRNEEWLKNSGDPQVMLGWIDSFPLWVQVLWPVGVWFSVLGSLLLLIRSRHAPLAFMISLVGAIGSLGYQLLASNVPPELATTANKVIPLVILALIVFFWWYARRALSRGWLG